MRWQNWWTLWQWMSTSGNWPERFWQCWEAFYLHLIWTAGFLFGDTYQFQCPLYFIGVLFLPICQVNKIINTNNNSLLIYDSLPIYNSLEKRYRNVVMIVLELYREVSTVSCANELLPSVKSFRTNSVMALLKMISYLVESFFFKLLVFFSATSTRNTVSYYLFFLVKRSTRFWRTRIVIFFVFPVYYIFYINKYYLRHSRYK